MAQRSHLEVQAAAWRDLAERAQRLASGLFNDPARDALLKYSEELQEKAAKLESGSDIREVEGEP